MVSARRRTLPLLAALLAVLVPLVLAVAGAVIWQGYQKSQQAAMGAGQQLFQALQTDVAVQEQGMFEPLRFVITAFSEDPEFGAGTPDRYQGAFMRVLETYSHVSGMRVGYQTGELFEVTAIGNADKASRISALAPEKTSFVVRMIERAPQNKSPVAYKETLRFFDSARVQLSEQVLETAPEDPRQSEWYVQAKAGVGQVIETRPYIMNLVGQPVISLAKTTDSTKPGVLAADIELSKLSDLVGGLAADANEQLFLFYNSGELVAHPDSTLVFGQGPWTSDKPFTLPSVSTLKDPVAQSLVRQFNESGPFGIQTIKVADTPYFAAVIQLGQSDIHMAIALPESNFTGVFDAIGRDGVLVSLLILALSIPVIIYVARLFSRPLALLAKETDRIAQFNLTSSQRANTRISEIASLSDATERLKTALGQVTKFVPKSLVQDLVRSGTQMDVGGERRLISVLMTDVKDFTTLAESIPAEALMTQMSEYFEVVVRAVLSNGGTVDKYVGDAVFAFWNAPQKQANHEHLVCRAALAARAASNELNQQWVKVGKPIWYTRLGVHMGEAVVGNVGSSDRLDYTAIGDTVNMGSRLEGLNKVYNTQILASGPVVAKASDQFLFRPIDLAVPKGAIQPIEIFELCGAHSDTHAHLTNLCLAWTKVVEVYKKRDWHNAYRAVIDFTTQFPDDGPGKVFEQRITHFMAEPPAANWDGAIRFDSK